MRPEIERVFCSFGPFKLIRPMHSLGIIYAMDASIDLKRLQHMVLLAEELNFSRAAERACLSQTAFSRSIQALEADFGMRLFDRATRSVQLTTTGRHMLEKARDLLGRARDMALEADYLAQADGGTLRFGASLFAVDTVLAGVFSEFANKRPGLRVDVEVSQWQVLLQHLETEAIEFFIAYPSDLSQDPRIKVTALAARSASLYCRAAHPLLKSTESSPRPEQIPDFPWAMIQIDQRLAVQMRGMFGMDAEQELPISLRCDNQALLREAVLHSDTILFTWEAWLRSELKNKMLVDLGERIRPSIPAQARLLNIGVVQLAGRTLSPAARKFIEFVLECEGLSTDMIATVDRLC